MDFDPPADDDCAIPYIRITLRRSYTMKINDINVWHGS